MRTDRAHVFFWTELCIAAGVSVVGNATQAVLHTTAMPAVAATVAVIPPLALLAAVHGVALLTRAHTASPTARRAATALTVVIAGGAFWLSFTALRALAITAGVARRRSMVVAAHSGGQQSVDCTTQAAVGYEVVGVATDSELRNAVAEGLTSVPRVGAVIAGPGTVPPFVVVDAQQRLVDPAVQYLRDLALGDVSPLTCKSYGYDLLRWFRLLWLLGMDWDHATEAEVALLVGSLRNGSNPQRVRQRAGTPGPGTVNVRTGKQQLKAGYAPRTINHCLSVICGFYAYHGSFGRGPVLNPVPESTERREALRHLSPLEPKPVVRRARLRQRIPQAAPRSIPDSLWDELFDAMRNDRDRSLLLFYVSSAARASELLGIGAHDIDWGGMRIWVVSKGSRARQDIPADPQAFVYLARYFESEGLPAPGQPVFRTLRGEQRPLTYWALRRILQRANDRLNTNWTCHDLRHTAATRLVSDPALTLAEVQRILRHANLATVSIYTQTRVEDMFDRLQQHYGRPRPEVSYPAGYAADDVSVVFGA
ncbi:tyrosine-type recombinase/integrase [Nocardia salmonicida]|uniref:tyrosine-type recombinase/integrase n=1 Tax=Nocardia salmonicida TaxID=53431 RepID=UPI0034068591